MRNLDQERIAEWIGDAFAILCVRVGGLSAAETKLRLGFETILRHLGTSPLHVVTKAGPPPHVQFPASRGDLRQIMKALDSCLATFERYDAVLTSDQRRIQLLIRATRRFAEEELNSRHGTELAPLLNVEA